MFIPPLIKKFDPGPNSQTTIFGLSIDPLMSQINLSNSILPYRVQLAAYGSGYPMSIWPLNQKFDPGPNFNCPPQTTIFDLPIDPPIWQIYLSNKIPPDRAHWAVYHSGHPMFIRPLNKIPRGGQISNGPPPEDPLSETLFVCGPPPGPCWEYWLVFSDGLYWA